jgi:hypothetical protein
MATRLLLSLALLGSVQSPRASANTLNSIDSEVIDVAGYIHEAPPQDQELVQIKQEIERQRKEAVLNKEKAKGFQELSKSVEKLTETTVEMLEEKRAAQEEIANYNAKVKCLQADNPGPECDKYVRRRRN